MECPRCSESLGDQHLPRGDDSFGPGAHPEEGTACWGRRLPPDQPVHYDLQASGDARQCDAVQDPGMAPMGTYLAGFELGRSTHDHLLYPGRFKLHFERNTGA